MWSFSVLSVESREAFWSHRVKGVEPVFSGHDISYEGYGRLIFCAWSHAQILVMVRESPLHPIPS